MNIFVLDTDPRLNARYHCDSHVVKMILEYAQLLSYTYRYLMGVDGRYYKKDFNEFTGNFENKYKKNKLILEFGEYDGMEKSNRSPLYYLSHVNHPCSIWTRQSLDNYMWLYNLSRELLDEYTHRYGRVHASSRTIEFCFANLRHINERFPIRELTPFELAMPQEYKQPNAVDAYRDYYVGEKAHICKWTKRETPEWFEDIIIPLKHNV